MTYNLTVRCNGRQYPVTTLRQVAEAYIEAVNRSGIGLHKAPECLLYDASGELWGHVSITGKIWRGRTIRLGQIPVFDLAKIKGRIP